MSNTIDAVVEVINFKDIINFAFEISKLDSFAKLTPEEKMKIICSYPFKVKCTF